MSDTVKRIEAAMEKYAPCGYDAASDDLTIPFAIELAEKDAEIARLRRGIQNIINGDYEPRVKKMDRCPHGRYGYETCEACIDEALNALLRG